MTPTKKTTTPKTTKAPAAAKRPAVKKAAVPKKAAAPRKSVPKKKAAEEAPVVVEAAVAPKIEIAPVVVREEAAPKEVKPKDYIYTLGRRKSAIAQVRMRPEGKGDIMVNGKKFDEYFTTFEMRDSVRAPLKAVGMDDKVNIDIQVRGGGLSGQSLAVRLGITRALMKFNETYRPSLKKLGFVMRDPREKERKKYGLKKARKGPQWAKR